MNRTEPNKHDIALTAALGDLRQAEEALHSAISAIKSKTATALRCQMACADAADRQSVAISWASSYRSTASGGPTTANNIIEAAKRDAAIWFLSRPPHFED